MFVCSSLTHSFIHSTISPYPSYTRSKEGQNILLGSSHLDHSGWPACRRRETDSGVCVHVCLHTCMCVCMCVCDWNYSNKDSTPVDPNGCWQERFPNSLFSVFLLIRWSPCFPPKSQYGLFGCQHHSLPQERHSFTFRLRNIQSTSSDSGNDLGKDKRLTSGRAEHYREGKAMAILSRRMFRMEGWVVFSILGRWNFNFTDLCWRINPFWVFLFLWVCHSAHGTKLLKASLGNSLNVQQWLAWALWPVYRI